jgi:hypothetical protein
MEGLRRAKLPGFVSGHRLLVVPKRRRQRSESSETFAPTVFVDSVPLRAKGQPGNVDHRIRKLPPVTQEEDGQDRNDYEPDDVRQQNCGATAKVPCPCNDCFTVRSQELLYAGLRLKTPPMFFAKLRNNCP